MRFSRLRSARHLRHQFLLCDLVPLGGDWPPQRPAAEGRILNKRQDKCTVTTEYAGSPEVRQVCETFCRFLEFSRLWDGVTGGGRRVAESIPGRHRHRAPLGGLSPRRDHERTAGSERRRRLASIRPGARHHDLHDNTQRRWVWRFYVLVYVFASAIAMSSLRTNLRYVSDPTRGWPSASSPATRRSAGPAGTSRGAEDDAGGAAVMFVKRPR